MDGVSEEGQADDSAARFGADKCVLNVEARLPEEGREVVEVEGESGELVRLLGDEGFSFRVRAEKVFAELGLGGLDRVGEFFELRQFANEGEDVAAVGLTGGADGEHMGDEGLWFMVDRRGRDSG